MSTRRFTDFVERERPNAPSLELASDELASEPGRPDRTDEILDLVLQNRAALDVLFEAVSFIQSSLTEGDPAERGAAYNQFKDALYRRLDETVDDLRADHQSAPSAGPAEPTPEPRTLSELWPHVAPRVRPTG